MQMQQIQSFRRNGVGPIRELEGVALSPNPSTERQYYSPLRQFLTNILAHHVTHSSLLPLNHLPTPTRTVPLHPAPVISANESFIRCLLPPLAGRDGQTGRDTLHLLCLPQRRDACVEALLRTRPRFFSRL